MRFIKRSQRTSPRVSLVLLDWSVRESFHLLHYLGRQTAPRDAFEVIVIEYYSRVSDALQKFADQVDTWLVLDMPENCYYHKHLMYNAGIAVANGDIVMIGDSDAMVKPSFIDTIIRNFDRDPKIAYHIDQFRNLRRDFYPFNYPSFEEVLGDGCINNMGGKTSGVLNTEDPIHSRNYGACMCARRADLIAIGGSDMHIDYLGHICGPYDLTFRLINYGHREVWDLDEFMYHTWHPGQAGADNYLGPHDGRHMSTTSLEALASGRVFPLAENEAIRLLRTGAAQTADDALARLIPTNAAIEWDLKYVEANASHLRWSDYTVPLGVHKAYRLTSELGRIFAYPIGERGPQAHREDRSAAFEGATEAEVRAKIDAETTTRMMLVGWVARFYGLTSGALRSVAVRSQRLPVPLRPRAKALLGLLLAPFGFALLLVLAPAPLIGKVRRWRRRPSAGPLQLSEVAVALGTLGHRGSLNDSGGTPMLLLAERESVYFMKLLHVLGLVPRLTIRCTSDLDQAKAAMSKLEQDHWGGQLLITSELFNRFHAVIAPSPAARRLIVI